ncbi:DUF1003 domain-containing protein [Brevibacterium samyangense]|uniref:DUF1003 domain-containing protein n=1 Tax=Brevibacterium samyangense TaxID=366888 RepID=A0ABN2TA05_9MICO
MADDRRPRAEVRRAEPRRTESRAAEARRPEPRRPDGAPRTKKDVSLDTPRARGRGSFRLMSRETFGAGAEAFARFMGTPQFLVGMTIFCGVWLAWNSLAPVPLQFDPKALNYTLLTLILSLQASYAAPLLLLAENRSADRDRVEFETDRQRAERNLADTEYLTREVASLRIAMRDMATRDFIRSELRDLVGDLEDHKDDLERRAADLDARAADLEERERRLQELLDRIDSGAGSARDAGDGVVDDSGNGSGDGAGSARTDSDPPA